MPRVTENRKKAWGAADRRHNMALSAAERNSRENEIGDHYSVGADLGPIAGPVLGAAQELIGRPLLSKFPDLGNKLAPSVFNFKTESNQRPGAIDPYKPTSWGEAAENLKATVGGSLDNWPRIQKMLGLDDELD